MKLLQHLLSLQTKTIFISELKEHFTPIELVTNMETLLNSGFIEVDWQKKTISVSGDYIDMIMKRHNIASYKRETPEYMNTEKSQINKPTI